MAVGAPASQLREQSDAGSGGHHLPECLEARCPEILFFARTDAAADLEGLVPQTVSVLEQQQSLALQILDSDGVARGESVVVRHRDSERLRIQLAGLQAFQRHRQRQDAQVDLSELELLEHGSRLVLVQAQVEARQRFADGLRNPRQQVRTDRRQQSDPQRARERIAMRARESHDFIAGLENSPRARHYLLTRVCEGHMTRLALNELHAEVLLQFFQLRGQRGLADKAALGRASEMPGVRHSHQVPQILQLEVGQVHAPYIWHLSTL